MAKEKIGEILIANGIINHDQLQEALNLQRQTGGLLGLILVNLKYLDPDMLSLYLEMQRSGQSEH